MASARSARSGHADGVCAVTEVPRSLRSRLPTRTRVPARARPFRATHGRGGAGNRHRKSPGKLAIELFGQTRGSSARSRHPTPASAGWRRATPAIQRPAHRAIEPSIAGSAPQSGSADHPAVPKHHHRPRLIEFDIRHLQISGPAGPTQSRRGMPIQPQSGVRAG